MKFLNKITSIASACFLTLALTGCSDYLDVSDEVSVRIKPMDFPGFGYPCVEKQHLVVSV